MIGSNRIRRSPANRHRRLIRRAALTAITAAALALAAAVAASASGSGGRSGPRAHAAYAQQCRDPFPATRDAANPLMLPAAPGPNPLRGATFFVDGPRHGSAASAIAQLMGHDPNRYSDSYSWPRFREGLTRGAAARKLRRHNGVARKVALLEKIADQPEAQRISSYSEGGGPGGIFSQTQKIFCHNMTADPRLDPVITTYFLHASLGGLRRPRRRSRPPGRISADVSTRWPRRPATARRCSCSSSTRSGPRSASSVQGSLSLLGGRSALRGRQRISSLPHTVVYLEAGYSDANSPRYTARVLNASGVRQIRGFYTNDTHSNWTINEIRWGMKVSRHDPRRPLHRQHRHQRTRPAAHPIPGQPRHRGLCNPPGRGIGPSATTTTGFAQVDAFLWTVRRATAAATATAARPRGTFWAKRAVGLAARAQGKLARVTRATPISGSGVRSLA